MKNKILGIFIAMLLIINFIPIALTSSEQVAIKERFDTIEISELLIRDEEQYITIDFDESTSLLLDPGKPILPVIAKTYLFPFGTTIDNVECEPSQIIKKSLKKEIQPSPIPVSSGVHHYVRNYYADIIDESVYNSNELFPYSWYDYRVSCGLEGDDHLVFLTIQFYPVRYSPGQDLIQYVNNIEISIEYHEPTQPVVFNDEYDMVIIAPSEFIPDLEPLEEYKDESGRETILVTLDDIYTGTYFAVKGRDDQEKIKYFIKNALEQWDIDYVLLAGGENKVPLRMSHVPDGEEPSLISDLYYADIYRGSSTFCSWDFNENNIFGEYNDDEGNIDKVDLRPDVRLGRLCFRKVDEVNGVVDKIIDYETSGAYMDEWFSNMLLVAGDTHPGDYQEIPEGEYLNEEALKIMDGFVDDKIWATNKKVKWSENIDKAIENGSGFLHMSGHGTPDCWTTHPHMNENTWWPLGTYLNLYVANLKNSDMLPVIIIGGCSNCQFTENPCFGWTWVKNPDGGAIASYGNSALGWGYTGTYVSEGLGGAMQLCGFRAYGEQNAKTTGELWIKALSTYLNNFGASSSRSVKTVEEWISFSDPSLRIAKISERPNKPDKPDGPTSGAAGAEYTYTSRTTEPDGDLIKYCFDWGDESVTWTDWMSAGENISLSHIWEPGDFEIKVKARDEYGIDSEWSDSTFLHIGGPVLDVVSVKGGLLSLRVKIENNGDTDAKDINWSITVKGGVLNLIRASSGGDIDELLMGNTELIKCNSIFGFGKVDITIIAESPSSNKVNLKMKGLVLGFLVLA